VNEIWALPLQLPPLSTRLNARPVSATQSNPRTHKDIYGQNQNYDIYDNPAVDACFTGLYIETHEPEEAIRDLTQLARRESWRLGIWDCDAGLSFPCAEVPVPVNPSELSDPLAVLRSSGQLSQGSETTLLVFQNFHRFLGATEILQAVQKQVSSGKHARTFIVILAPVVSSCRRSRLAWPKPTNFPLAMIWPGSSIAPQV